MSKKRKRNPQTSTTSNKPLTTGKTKTSKFSHALDIYESTDFSYDFADLALSYPSFADQWEQLKSRRENITSIDSNGIIQGKVFGSHTYSCFGTFVTHEFNLELTRAILHKHHGGMILPSMPQGRLCPPIPNRLNYVRWMKDLIYGKEGCNDDHAKSQSSSRNHNFHFRGIDIGAGASCIYPLLLSSIFSSEKHLWKFFATEVDPISFRSAQENVNANKLNHQITVALVQQTKDEPNLGSKHGSKLQSVEQNTVIRPVETAVLAASKHYENSEADTDLQFDFCMTNPPFYSSIDQCSKPRMGDNRERTSMSLSESFYPRGGEEAFILDMIHDSLTLRQKITWYSSLIGQKSTLECVERELANFGFGKGNVRVAEFVQGQRGNQRRWGIAWTFMEIPVRSLDAKMESGLQMFIVDLSRKDTISSSDDPVTCPKSYNTSIKKISNDVMSNSSSIDVESSEKTFRLEVARRILQYCDFIQKRMDWKLLVTQKEISKNQDHNMKRNCVDDMYARTVVTIVEDLSSTSQSINLESSNALSSVDEKTMKYESASKVKYSKSEVCGSFLPKEGHFLIDAIIQNATAELEKRNEDNDVIVTLNCFSHTRRGDMIIHKIKSQIQGEVRRSNRRWRRMLK